MYSVYSVMYILKSMHILVCKYILRSTTVLYMVLVVNSGGKPQLSTPLP